VLGVRSEWHRSHSLAHSRLIRALSQASAWLADPANRPAAVEIIASKRYVNTPKTVVEGALKDAAERGVPDGNAVTARFYGGAPDSPSQAHAKWYLEQMTRWGHVDVTPGPGPDLSTICLEGFYQSVTSGFIKTPPAPVVTRAAAIR
jgi:ABC-type nitrate/sulfonate/bicarbonate transport system substrate-binding protein